MEKKPHIDPTTPHSYFRPVFDDLASIQRHDLIVQCLEAIAPHLPHTTNSYDLVSYGYHKAKRYLKSIEWGERALASTTDNATKGAIRFNLSKAYNNANFPEKAEKYLTLNTRYCPEDVDSWIDLSVAIYGQNRKNEAETLLRNSLTRGNFSNPLDKKIVQFNLGTHDLRAGRFQEGMANLSIGRELRIWGSRSHDFPIPEWTGQSHPGARVLVVGEGGIGDEIINSRFVHELKNRELIPSWASAHGLARVFARMPFESTQNYTNFTSDIPNIRDFDYWTPAMNLPHYLNISSDQLWNGAYLSVDPESARKWNWMNKSQRLKIGLRWSGNPLYEQDLHRSLPMTEIWKLVQNLDADFYSLQRDHDLGPLESCQGLRDLSSDLTTFDDTLAVINNLDLVISSCTSVAHASAALDRPTLILTPIMCYYTWAEETSTSSWYGSHTHILRQQSPRDWSEPLKSLPLYLDLAVARTWW